MKVLKFDKDSNTYTFTNGHTAIKYSDKLIVYGKNCVLKPSGIGYQKAVDAIITFLKGQNV
jgi:hypothetical protein